MRQRILFAPLFAITALTLNAQGVFTNADSPSDATCPRLMREKTYLERTGGGSLVLHHQQGDWLIPQNERKDVSLFAAYDEKAKGISLSSLRGKVVLVGLWSKNCDPSAKMLMEFAALYPKRHQFDFDILAINFDENQQDGGAIEGGWRAIHKFMNKNRQFFEVSKMPVFTPGLGKEGPSNFMDMVYSVPVLFVVDRLGRLAEVHIGYEDGFVGKALSRAIVEKPLPSAPAPTGGPARSEPAKPSQP